MTDNNGKALREAKAYLTRGLSGVRTGSHTEIALLAALVEEIEAAPVTTAYELTDVEAGGMVVDAWNFKDGQRVRVLAVGEDG